MKISLDTVEMSDEQRNQLAIVLDGKVSKRKATRAEAKAFVWDYGKTWAETLQDMANGDEPAPSGEANDSEVADSDDDADLIGEPDLDELL